jgi:hypothetical protein
MSAVSTHGIDEARGSNNSRPDRLTRWLLAAGVAGPLLFFVVLLVEGATRAGYSALQTDGSYLALTDQGWEQIANFIVFGCLMIAYAAGLGRLWRAGRAAVWGPRLIGLLGLSLLALGVFVTDPGGGYPPGTPINATPHSWHGWAHGITGLLYFNVLLPAACFVFSRRFAADPVHRTWATYSWLTGAVILGVSVLATILLPIAEKAGFPVLDGLVQRVLIGIGWAWLALTALRLLRQEGGG